MVDEKNEKYLNGFLRYLSIVEDYQHVIGGQLFAHHHTDSVKIFLSNVNSDPVAMAFLVPGLLTLFVASA